jgi:hypothetical protein
VVDCGPLLFFSSALFSYLFHDFLTERLVCALMIRGGGHFFYPFSFLGTGGQEAALVDIYPMDMKKEDKRVFFFLSEILSSLP